MQAFAIDDAKKQMLGDCLLRKAWACRDDQLDSTMWFLVCILQTTTYLDSQRRQKAETILQQRCSPDELSTLKLDVQKVMFTLQSDTDLEPILDSAFYSDHLFTSKYRDDTWLTDSVMCEWQQMC